MRQLVHLLGDNFDFSVLILDGLSVKEGDKLLLIVQKMILRCLAQRGG